MPNSRYHYTKCPIVRGTCGAFINLFYKTVLSVFVLVSHIVICNSYTTSNTSDRSNTKTSNTSTVS